MSIARVSQESSRPGVLLLVASSLVHSRSFKPEPTLVMTDKEIVLCLSVTTLHLESLFFIEANALCLYTCNVHY